MTHVTWAEHYEDEEEMYNASDLVVRATVVSSQFNRTVGRGDRSIPITQVVLRVTDELKGNASRVVRLEQTRGPSLEVVDDPGYVSGDSYTLYLRAIGANAYRVVNPDGRIRN